MLAGHSSVGEDGTGLQDPEWVADFEHLTTEDLAEQIEQMRLQVRTTLSSACTVTEAWEFWAHLLLVHCTVFSPGKGHRL